MKKVAIVTDGSCDIPKSVVEQYNIHIVPFRVIFGDEIFKTYGDWGTLTKEEFYLKLATSSVSPTSAIPGIPDFQDVFQEALNSADSVIAIFLSQKFSGLHQAACKISSTMEGKDITIVDSKVSTSSLGVLVIEAAKMAQKGKGKEEILERLNELIPQARLVAILDSVDAVYRSGRVGWAKKFLVSSLKIKPIVNFEDGLIVSGGTLQGAKEVIKRLKFAASIIVTQAVTDTIVIWHVRYLEVAKEIADFMEEHNKFGKTIIIQEAGPVVGTHVGERSLGLMYIGPYKKQWLLKMKE
ncbi:MAG TPA: DegV family protein [candidate division Zixibacteria bacterium]|nr:DegV family protein [candidate division Zixibacteria bacterium]